MLNDVIILENDKGEIAAIISDAPYTENYTSMDRSYLKEGILVEIDNIGLVHFWEEYGDVNFIGREK